MSHRSATHGRVKAPENCPTSFVRVYQATQQTYPGGSATVKLRLDGLTHDYLGEFDAATNYRFTPRYKGLYLCTPTIYWNAVASGRIVGYYYVQGAFYARTTEGVGSGNDFVNAGALTIPLDPGAGDYLEMFVFSSTTGTPTFLTGTGNTQLTIARVG